MEGEEIRELLRKLAKPYSNDRVTVTSLAIKEHAPDADLGAICAWVEDADGTCEEVAAKTRPPGLRPRLVTESPGHTFPAHVLYVLPREALGLPDS